MEGLTLLNIKMYTQNLAFKHSFPVKGTRASWRNDGFYNWKHLAVQESKEKRSEKKSRKMEGRKVTEGRCPWRVTWKTRDTGLLVGDVDFTGHWKCQAGKFEQLINDDIIGL